MRCRRWMRILCVLSILHVQVASFAQKPEELLKKGTALIHASRPFEAEETLVRIGAADPGYSFAQTLLGFLLLNRAAVGAAEECFNRALAGQPGNAQARLGSGIALVRKGLLEPAAQEFSKILDDPDYGIQARVQHIQCLYWMGREDQAASEAQSQAEEYPAYADYQALVGFFHQIRGQTREALQAYRKALDLQPYRISNYLNLVSIYRSMEDWKSSLYLLEKVRELDPNNPLIYSELELVYEKLGRAEEAESARREARHVLDAEVLYTRATNARVAGRAAEAQRLLRECVQTNPRMSKAWTDLGEMMRQGRRYDDAAGFFQRAIEADPSNRLAHLGMAASLQSKGEDRQGAVGREQLLDTPPDWRLLRAQAALSRAAANSPNDPDLLSSLGYLYESLGRDREALELFNDALKLNPLQIDALLGRGRALLKQGDTAGATSAFRNVTELDPSKEQAWYDLVDAYRKSKNIPGALSAARSCLSLLQGDLHCREQMAHLLMDSADYGGAAKQFRILADRRADSKDILDGLGFALMKMGERDEAIRVFKTSLARHGRDGWVYSNLGFLHQARGDLRPAIADYRLAHQMLPDDAEIEHALGYALYLGRDFAAAAASLKSAVRKRPDWGLAHFNLAMTYWNLHQCALALEHAKVAQEKGVPQAESVVRTLSANLSSSPPRILDVFRSKP